jgi:transposase
MTSGMVDANVSTIEPATTRAQPGRANIATGHEEAPCDDRDQRLRHHVAPRRAREPPKHGDDRRAHPGPQRRLLVADGVLPHQRNSGEPLPQAVRRERCQNATLCTDGFHVVAWATDALNQVRREVWNQARRAGMRQHAAELKGCRYALWKNPEDLTARQETKPAWIATVNTRLYRAYLLKEQLRAIIRLKGRRALVMLDAWLAWASRCRIEVFVELGRRIRKNRPGIEAALTHNLSNALIESTNTKIRVLHRMAFGFKKPEHLIALAFLDRGGYCLPLPGREAA